MLFLPLPGHRGPGSGQCPHGAPDVHRREEPLQCLLSECVSCVCLVGWGARIPWPHPQPCPRAGTRLDGEGGGGRQVREAGGLVLLQISSL